MNPRSVPEIREAIALFEEYERSLLNHAAAKKFNEAVELLNDYLEAEPDSPHKDFIHRLRFSNTRSMLRNLARVNKKDFFTWGEHVFAILLRVNSEAEALMGMHPDLKKDSRSFLTCGKKNSHLGLLKMQRDHGSEA